MSDRYEQMKNAKGVSRDEAFSKFLTNEALHDVSLKGSDGVSVKANRWALAARSEVFEKMLLGQFKETTDSEVEVGFKGSVLQAVVEFICTDKATILELHTETKESVLQEDFERMHLYLSIFEAASYFDLPGLYQNAHRRVEGWMRDMPSLSFAVLEACTQNVHLAPQDLKEEALSNICSYPSCTKDEESIVLLGPGAVGEILQYRDAIMDESSFFRVLEIWAKGENLTLTEADAGSDRSTHQDRKSLASELLAKHIELKNMDPKYLSSKVASSGLVTKDQLFEAYKSQALASRSDKVKLYKKPRLTPLWNHSMSEILAPKVNSEADAVLRYPPMVSGIHKWKLKVEKTSRGDWLGIFHSKLAFEEIPGIYFKNHEGFWMFGNNGDRFEDGKRIECASIKFEKGSKVTITLDLVPNEDGNGTLSASVDDGESITLFTGLRAYLDSNSGGFRPSIGTCVGGRFRLVKIERL